MPVYYNTCIFDATFCSYVHVTLLAHRQDYPSGHLVVNEADSVLVRTRFKLRILGFLPLGLAVVLLLWLITCH